MVSNGVAKSSRGRAWGFNNGQQGSIKLLELGLTYKINSQVIGKIPLQDYQV